MVCMRTHLVAGDAHLDRVPDEVSERGEPTGPQRPPEDRPARMLQQAQRAGTPPGLGGTPPGLGGTPPGLGGGLRARCPVLPNERHALARAVPASPHAKLVAGHAEHLRRERGAAGSGREPAPCATRSVTQTVCRAHARARNEHTCSCLSAPHREGRKQGGRSGTWKGGELMWDAILHLTHKHRARLVVGTDHREHRTRRWH